MLVYVYIYVSVVCVLSTCWQSHHVRMERVRQAKERERGKCHVCFCYEDLSLFAIKSIIAIENTANKLLNY